MKFNEGLIFLTTNDAKLNILDELVENGEVIQAIIFPFVAKDESKIDKLIRFANENNIDYFRPKINNLVDERKKINPCEFLITAGYPFILKPEVLSLCKYNLNVHPTLLPKYRGPNIEWNIIANGEKETGVSVHFLSKLADKGNIVLQKKVELTSFDTISSLLRKTSEIEPALLLEAMDMVRNGDDGYVQDETQVSYYPQLRTPDDSEIDPSKSIEELYNCIRASDPDRFPAFFIKDGEKIGVRLFRVNKPKNEEDCI